MPVSVNDSTVVSENIAIFAGGLTQTNLGMIVGDTYTLIFIAQIFAGSFKIYQGSQLIYDTSITSTGTVDFVVDDTGDFIQFLENETPTNIILDVVGLKHLTSAIVTNSSIKEFLTGNTDEGIEINFRVDSQTLHLMGEFEIFAHPLSIVTKLHRGTLVKCFIALGDDDFYELEGNAVKGVSLVKVHSQNRSNIATPPIAREVRLSWRDSSKQLCRLIQGGIVFLPTDMDIVE